MKRKYLLYVVLVLGMVLALPPLAEYLTPPQVVTINIGAEEGLNAQGQSRHLYNFFGWGNPGTEQGQLARRIDSTASFMLPWAFRMGDTLEVYVTMCGCGSTEDARLSINGTPYDIPLTNDWTTRHAVVEYEPTMYDQALYLEWQSDASPRPLVSQVIVLAQEPFAITGDGHLWFGIGLLVIIVLGLLQRLVSSKPFYPGAVIWYIVLIASFVASRSLYQPQLMPWEVLVGLGMGTAVLLTLLAPEIKRRLILWVIALWVLTVPQILGTWILDDAFISFRYASNLVEGHGLTFNPGGDIVEGYTNFLWTVIIAGFIERGFEPVLTAQILSTGLSLATLLLAYRMAEAWWPGRIWCVLPPLLLAVNPSFLLYTARGSGMEAALVTFLALLALWVIWKARSFGLGFLAGLLCALVALARPDGALVALAGGLILLVQAIFRNRHPGARAALIGLVIGFALAYGPYFGWRYTTYGYLLPNSFYAKVGFTEAQVLRGWEYTLGFVQSLGWRSLVVLLALSLIGLFRSGVLPAPGDTLARPLPRPQRKEEPEPDTGRETEASGETEAAEETAEETQKPEQTPPPAPPAPVEVHGYTAGPAAFLWLFVLLTGGYVTLVGGDQFPLGRFFVPALPPLMLLVTHGFSQAWELYMLAASWASKRSGGSATLVKGIGLLPPAAAEALVILFILINVSPLPQLDSRDPSGRIWGENRVALKNREIGLWLHNHTEPDTVIATGIAGAMPYYAERRVIDTLGLNDTHIAHLPVETMGEGVAGAEKTDIGYVLDQQPDYITFSSSEPYQDNVRFQQEYELIKIRGPEGGEIELYRRAEG